jgi:hypothetical protein
MPSTLIDAGARVEGDHDSDNCRCAVRQERAPMHSSGKPRRFRRPATTIIVSAAMLLAAPAAAFAAPTGSGKASYTATCGAAGKGEFTCFALHRDDIKATRGIRPLVDLPAGFGPADLQSAYALPANGGAGATVAIVDAYDDPTAEADLAIYRQQYGLPRAPRPTAVSPRSTSAAEPRTRARTRAGPGRSPSISTWCPRSPQRAHPAGRGGQPVVRQSGRRGGPGGGVRRQVRLEQLRNQLRQQPRQR